MGERLVYLTKQDIEGRDKPVMKGTIIDVEKGVEWPLTSQESERISNAVASVQQYPIGPDRQNEAIQDLRKIIDEVSAQAQHDTRGIRELKQAGVKFGEGKPSIMGKPVDRNLI